MVINHSQCCYCLRTWTEISPPLKSNMEPENFNIDHWHFEDSFWKPYFLGLVSSSSAFWGGYMLPISVFRPAFGSDLWSLTGGTNLEILELLAFGWTKISPVFSYQPIRRQKDRVSWNGWMFLRAPNHITIGLGLYKSLPYLKKAPLMSCAI